MTSLSRRDELTEYAAKLLDDGGPGNVTLRAVGQAAGLSHNAPYRHFSSKGEILAAVAARELDRLSKAKPDSLRGTLKQYIAWARLYPERFKLVFGRWDTDYENLEDAAMSAQETFFLTVQAAQADGDLPAGDPMRIGVLLRTLAHGAADLELSGHLARSGKGDATPEGLVDDLFNLLDKAADR